MTLNLTKSALLAAALAVPAAFAPAASASDYRNNGYNSYNSYNHNSGKSYQSACKDKEKDNKVAGGLIGAIAGGVIGAQVASGNARSEGTAIGAVLGGLAGVAIADDATECDNKRRYSGSTYGQTVYSEPVYDNYSHNNSYGYNNGYSQPQVYTTQPVYAPRPVYAPTVVISQPRPVTRTVVVQKPVTYRSTKYVTTSNRGKSYAQPYYNGKSYRGNSRTVTPVVTRRR